MKFTEILPSQSLWICIILQNKKSKDRAALVALISQFLYFHCHHWHVNFSIWLFRSELQDSLTWLQTPLPEMTALEKRGCSFPLSFKNIKLPFPGTLHETSFKFHWSAPGHMLTPNFLSLCTQSKFCLKVCTLHQTLLLCSKKYVIHSLGIITQWALKCLSAQHFQISALVLWTAVI